MQTSIQAHWPPFLALALIAAIARVLPAQSTTLIVGVAEAGTGAPLANVEVVLPELHRLARTNWLGEATLSRVPAGEQRIRVRKLGYAAADIDLLVHGDTLGPVFYLTPQSLALDTMRVTGRRVPLRLEPFEQRRQMGLGRFVTDSALATDANRDLEWVLGTRFPGVEVVRDAEGTPHVLSVRVTCSVLLVCGPCAVRVLLDDMPLPGEDFDLVRTWDLAGIEYYSGETMPAQYRTAGTGCGLLLLWSK